MCPAGTTVRLQTLVSLWLSSQTNSAEPRKHSMLVGGLPRRGLKITHTPDPRSKVPCPYLRHGILALASFSFVYERAVGRLIQPSATSQRSQDPISSAYVCLLHTNIAVYVPSSVSILAKYRAQFMIRQSAHGMFFAICEQRQRHETRIYFTGRGIETRELLTV